jgi:tetratricopeptide (TPR) repeat protein
VTDFLMGGSAWWMFPATLLTMAVIFGLVPGVALRLMVLLYPKDDPRRRELVAELYTLDRMRRIEWVFQQLETALFEGLSRRLAQRRERRRGEREDDPSLQETYETLPPRTDEDDLLRASSGSWVSNPVSRPVPGRIVMTDVREVEAATRALRSLEYQYGGGFCRDAVVAQLSWCEQMLISSGAEHVKKRLHVALADLHNLAGWTSFDIGLVDSARNHFGRALELAKAGDSDQLVANILYRIGRVYLHNEAPQDALKMFQLGQIAAQESGSELAVAVICANQAWAYAMMGYEEQAMKLIGRTRDEFQRANLAEAEDWVRFFNETNIYAMIGTVHTVLAHNGFPKHTQYAIPALTRALDNYGDEMGRSKVFNLSCLAINHLIEGDVDLGTKIGHQAVDLAQHLKSRVVWDRLLPLKIEADKHRHCIDARELSDTINRFHEAGASQGPAARSHGVSAETLTNKQFPTNNLA